MGGFYCGQDADSDGVEGKYYVFTPQELHSVLGEDDGKHFCDWFGVTQQGNFESKNILNLLENPRFEEENHDITALCQKLYDYRLSRTALHKDDKVLTAWNALMIAALARASWLLDEPRYLKAAQSAQCFIDAHLTGKDGRLFVRWREGEAAHIGQLDDYAFYAYALLELYQATFDAVYLSHAVRVADDMQAHFSDDSNGGFFLYAHDSESLLFRPKELYDGAIPSGNSAAAVVLGRLSKLTSEYHWQLSAERQLIYVCSQLKNYPAGYSFSLLALLEALYPSHELVCAATDPEAPAALIRFLRENSVLNLFVLIKTQENAETLSKASPFVADYRLPKSGAAYYLCQNSTCSAPVNTLEELSRKLKL